MSDQLALTVLREKAGTAKGWTWPCPAMLENCHASEAEVQVEQGESRGGSSSQLAILKGLYYAILAVLKSEIGINMAYHEQGRVQTPFTKTQPPFILMPEICGTGGS